MSINRRVNKIWYIHTMEYCSAIKRNEILKHGITWMNTENIKLRKISLETQFWKKQFL